MTRDELVLEVGQLIIGDPAFLDAGWEGIAIVSTIGPGNAQMNGYRYIGAEWLAAGTDENSDELFDTLEALQDAMAAETGRRWKQALIHITRPGPEIDIQFEYDDPTRWSLKKVSLDLADYAESLRPPRRGAAR